MSDKATQALYRAWGVFAATRLPATAPEAAGGPQEAPHDPTVARVAMLLTQRSAVGVAKYGTTVAASPLTRAQWLRHAQEEALDLAVYLQRLIDMETLPKERI